MNPDFKKFSDQIMKRYGRKKTLFGTGRKKKLHSWAKKSKQRGGFIFTFGAIAAAIASAVSAAAPAVATSVVGAAAAYGTNKLLTKVGGGRKRRIRRH